MVYDVSNITNSTNWIEYIQAANSVSGGFLINGLLGGLFVMAFITLKMYNTSDALMASSFSTFIASVLLQQASLCSVGTVVFWLAILVGVFIVTYIRDQS